MISKRPNLPILLHESSLVDIKIHSEIALTSVELDWQELMKIALEKLDPVRTYHSLGNGKGNTGTIDFSVSETKSEVLPFGTPYDWVKDHSLFSFVNDVSPTFDILSPLKNEQKMDLHSSTKSLESIEIANLIVKM